ncbi:hypothetical protein [Desulfosporosinus fructosivorans]
MKDLSQVQKSIRRPWVVVGMLLSIVIIGVGGCGAKAVTSSPATSSTETASTSTVDESATKSNQTANKMTINPAIDAAMGIRRLQGNEATVLTTEQKAIIKPILQTLIDTTSPSEDFLQQKADAINAVYTEAQKTYLSTNTPKAKPDGNSQTGQEPPKDQPKDQQKDQTNGQKGTPDGNQTAPSGQSQNIYEQVLASLT